MTDSTPDPMHEIRARAEAATPGPWGSYRNLAAKYTIQARPRVTAAGYETDGDVARLVGSDKAAYRNSRFMAHAREDIPWLLARVAELEADRAATVRRALEDAADDLTEEAEDNPMVPQYVGGRGPIRNSLLYAAEQLRARAVTVAAPAREQGEGQTIA